MKAKTAANILNRINETCLIIVNKERHFVDFVDQSDDDGEIVFVNQEGGVLVIPENKQIELYRVSR